MGVQQSGFLGLLGAVVLAGLGCGHGGKPIKFDGRLTLDDKPLAGALVEFIPMDERGRAAVGMSDQDGIFRLTTSLPGDGALPGFYKVRVTKDTDDESAGPPRQPTSKAEAMELYIKKGKQMALARAKAKRKSLVPAVYSDANKTPLRCAVPPEGKVVLALQSS